MSIPTATVTATPYDVMAVPANPPVMNATISSNVTIPAPQQTAAWTGPVPAPTDLIFRGSKEAEANLPKEFYWTLANSTISADQLHQICAQQVQYCATAGCSDDTDTISQNFCDPANGMATMCTCKKSVARLPQYQWPVQAQDCLSRLQACSDACDNQKRTPVPQRNQCKLACSDQIGSSCGKPEQYGVSYAVTRRGSVPHYGRGSQANPQSAGVRVPVHRLLIAATALGVVAFVSA